MEAASPSTAPRESARPATAAAGFDATYDIVVVGGGGAGLPTALFARWLGDRVLVLEKAPELGGTARKAAFWYWVPNNRPMRELGLEDPKDDCLRYMARLARHAVRLRAGLEDRAGNRFDRLFATHPWGRLRASERAVGLPVGQMGNSEVGHTNIGAGFVVYQWLTRLDRARNNQEFLENLGRDS